MTRTLAYPQTVRAVRFTPDGALLACACFDGNVHLWDTAKWKRAGKLRIRSLCSALAVSRDGSRVAGGNDRGAIIVWDLASREWAHRFGTSRQNVYSLDFAPDGQTLASANNDGTVGVWPMAGGAEPSARERHRGRVWALAYAPKGRTLASCGEDGQAVTSAASGGGKLTRWPVCAGHVSALAFTPDGSRMITGSLSHTYVGPTARGGGGGGCILVWDPKHPEDQGRPLDADPVHGLDVSPCGTLLASSHFGHTVKLWRIETGECLHVFEGHTDAVFAVAFAPDGKTLASGGPSGHVHIWDVPGGPAGVIPSRRPGRRPPSS